MARCTAIKLAIVGMLTATCWLPNSTLLQAAEGAGSGLSEQAKQQLEGKVQQLEQFLQTLRQERMSRPRDVVSESSEGGGCANFDELGETWNNVLDELNSLGDLGQIDDEVGGGEE